MLLGYKTAETTIAAATLNKFHNADITVHHKPSSSVTTVALATLGTGFGVGPIDADKVRKGLGLQFGAKLAVSADTSVYGAVARSGKVQFGYDTRVASNATLAVAGEVDAVNLASDSHRFGTKLSIVQ